MAREPLLQLYLELRLQNFRIRVRANAADQIKPGEPGILEARRGAGNQRLGRQRQPEVGHTLAVHFRSEKARRGDSNNRESLAIDLKGRSRHRRIGSVLPAPDAETHYGDRWCALPVIGIGEKPPTPR